MTDENEDTEKIDCLKHLGKLYKNIIGEGMQSAGELPIIVCGFSKGCIVLNEICKELLNSSLFDVELKDFISKLKHIMWLDGGHSGTFGAWITDRNIILNLLKLDVYLYVYTTPYQISDNNPKKWAVKEHRIFLDLLGKCFTENYNYKAKLYYLNEANVDDEKNYELEAHFKILKLFDCQLFVK